MHIVAALSVRPTVRLSMCASAYMPGTFGSVCVYSIIVGLKIGVVGLKKIKGIIS